MIDNRVNESFKTLEFSLNQFLTGKKKPAGIGIKPADDSYDKNGDVFYYELKIEGWTEGIEASIKYANNQIDYLSLTYLIDNHSLAKELRLVYCQGKIKKYYLNSKKEWVLIT